QRWGHTSPDVPTHPTPGAPALALLFLGAGDRPFPAPRPPGPPRRDAAASAISARATSTSVSTIATCMSPLSRVETSWVGSTRNPPPKTYGAENEASDESATSNAPLPIAGLSSGNTTVRSARARDAPSEEAASSIAGSNDASAPRTSRYG